MSRAINWKGRALLLYFVALFAFGLGVTGLAAHSRLTKSDPAARAVLETAPKELKLWFNEAVEPAFAKVWIVPAEGQQIPLTSRGDSSDPKLLVVTMPDNVPAGAVVIGYLVLAGCPSAGGRSNLAPPCRSRCAGVLFCRCCRHLVGRSRFRGGGSRSQCFFYKWFSHLDLPHQDRGGQDRDCRDRLRRGRLYPSRDCLGHGQEILNVRPGLAHRGTHRGSWSCRLPFQ